MRSLFGLIVGSALVLPAFVVGCSASNPEAAYIDAAKIVEVEEKKLSELKAELEKSAMKMIQKQITPQENGRILEQYEQQKKAVADARAKRDSLKPSK